MRLKWLAARLRVMSAPEVLHRIGEMLGLLALYWLQMRRRVCRGREVAAAELQFCKSEERCLFDPRPIPLEDQFRDFDEDAYWCLGHPWQWSDQPDVWRRAPDTGRLWPSTPFWCLDYRPGNPHGDIRVAWEPSRLQYLITLAASVRHTDEAGESIHRLEAILLSWWRENPPYMGIHYASAMECALRLIAILHAVDLARDALRDRVAVWDAVADISFHHWHLIRRRLSLYSSAGNHTVAETVGLLYVGVLFPEFRGSRQVAERALSRLASEMDRQVLSDGGSLEQAPGYLRFIGDLGRLATKLLEYAGWTVPEMLTGAVERAESHIDSMADWYAEATRPGDYDEGSALGFPLRPMNEIARSRLRAMTLVTHESTGLSVMNTHLDGHLGCMVDHGPLGMAPNFGHGHADALSVVLRWRGRPVLVDAGTYTYNGAPALRAYFRGTDAHNTVTVDALDQTEQRGTFLWAPFAGGELVRRELSAGGGAAILIRHAGYARVGVTHWRGVAALPDRGLIVWDRLTGDGPHRVALNWHMAGTWEERIGGAVLEVDADRLVLVVHGVVPKVKWGAGPTAPIASRSPKYGTLEPATHLIAEQDGALPIEFCTEVSLLNQPVSESDRQMVVDRFRNWTSNQ